LLSISVFYKYKALRVTRNVLLLVSPPRNIELFYPKDNTVKGGGVFSNNSSFKGSQPSREIITGKSYRKYGLPGVNVKCPKDFIGDCRMIACAWP